MTDDDIRKALLSSFLEEARELLADLEAVLLELEDKPEDEELIARAFRALHTIKGNGAMFGFTAIESFAHELEMVFDRLRSGELRVSKALIDLTLASKDQIAAMLNEEGEEGEDPAGRLLRERLLDEVRKMAAAEVETEVEAEVEAEIRARRTGPGRRMTGGPPEREGFTVSASALRRRSSAPDPIQRSFSVSFATWAHAAPWRLRERCPLWKNLTRRPVFSNGMSFSVL